MARPLGVDSVSVVSFDDHKFVSWDLNRLASGYKIYRREGEESWNEVAVLSQVRINMRIMMLKIQRNISTECR